MAKVSFQYVFFRLPLHPSPQLATGNCEVWWEVKWRDVIFPSWLNRFTRCHELSFNCLPFSAFMVKQQCLKNVLISEPAFIKYLNLQIPFMINFQLGLPFVLTGFLHYQFVPWVLSYQTNNNFILYVKMTGYFEKVVDKVHNF